MTESGQDEERDYQQRLADLGVFSQVVGQLNRSLKPEDVLEASLTGIRAMLAADFGWFALFGHDSHVQVGSQGNVPPSLRERLERIELGTKPAGSASTGNPPSGISTLYNLLAEALRAEGIENYIIIPVCGRAHALGLLLFGIGEGKRFTHKSVDLLMSIGEQAGLTLENMRINQSVKESEAWYRTFIEGSQDAFVEVTVDGKMTFANDAACRLTGYDRETLLTIQFADLVLSSPDARRARVEELNQKGFLTDVAEKLRTRTGETRDTRCTVRAVRTSDGKTSGFQATARDVTEQQRTIMALERRRTELAALNKIAGILGNPLSIQAALDQVCEQIASITDMDGVALHLVDPQNKSLNLVAQRGLSEGLSSKIHHLGVDDPLLRRMFVSRQSFATNDVMSHPASILGRPHGEGFRAVIGAPILKRGLPVGTLFVGSKGKTQYDPPAVDLLLNIGSQIGSALENAELYTEMQRRVQELDGLAKLGAACNTSLDPNEIARIAVDLTRILLPVHFAMLRLLEGDRLRLVASYSAHPVTLSEYLQADEVFGPIVHKPMQFAATDVESYGLPPRHRKGFANVGIRSLLIVPMPSRDRVIGALAVAYEEPHEWQQREIDLLQTVANQVANAIDRARLFQNMMNEQRKVQALFDSGLSGLFATDAAGRIVMLNRAAERMTGWTSAEAEGRQWVDLFGDRATVASKEPLINEALLRKRTVFDQDGRFIRTRDGRSIPVAKAVAPLLDGKGNVTGAVGTFWDLTRERAAELEREEFLRMVAHQLRSPLTALLGALQLLERDNLSKEHRAEMQAVVKSDAERLRRFAEQFLDLEAVLKSGHPLFIQPLPIAHIVRELTRTFRSGNNKHTFRIQSSKPEPVVEADADRVEHVLRNLIDNAVSYSPEGSPITVSVKALPDGMVEIAVRDRGAGIPLAEQERIFEPFYRSVHIEGRRTYGHGLGLPIAEKMVREMGGAIWVTSKEGQGAVFHFTLRRHR